MKEITPIQAWDILQNNKEAVLLDVRSRIEYDYIGHPSVAVHVALKEPPAWDTDEKFVENVIEVLGDNAKQTPILAMCRSGKRSEMAATLLEAAGFTDVANVLEGFEGDLDAEKHRSSISGWRHHSLPWVQN